MGIEDSESFTEFGLRYVYRYFLLAFSITLSILILSLMLYFNQERMLEVTPLKIYFVLTIFFLFLIIFIYFIRGIAIIFNARKEFTSDHEINVIMGTLVFIAYFIIFFINLSLAGGFPEGAAFIAFASMGFDSSIMLVFIVVVIFSVLLYILLGLASFYLIKGLISKDRIKKLKKALILFALSTFTLSISGLIAYVLFYSVYRDAYLTINQGKLKAVITAPCPYCDKEIPMQSKICPYCETELKNIQEEEIDVKPAQDQPQ